MESIFVQVSDGKVSVGIHDDAVFVYFLNLIEVDNGLYLPANKCYLTVSSSAPDVLQIVTEAEYEEITGIEEMFSDVTEGAKVIYDLQGRRVAAPSKGVYIVNGKKVIVK